MKNLKTLMFALMVSGGIANAATLSHTTQVSANFQVTSRCTVTGSWATTPLEARQYPPFGAVLGTLSIDTEDCGGSGSPIVFFKGTETDTYGRPLATTPGGDKMTVEPDPSNPWDNFQNHGEFTRPTFGGNNTSSVVTLVNGDPWDAQPGEHHMTLTVGIYGN
ncbi:TPA: hypothetical protein ACS7WR_003767 [Providencia alcalifaciens]